MHQHGIRPPGPGYRTNGTSPVNDWPPGTVINYGTTTNNINLQLPGTYDITLNINGQPLGGLISHGSPLPPRYLSVPPHGFPVFPRGFPVAQQQPPPNLQMLMSGTPRLRFPGLGGPTPEPYFRMGQVEGPRSPTLHQHGIAGGWNRQALFPGPPTPAAIDVDEPMDGSAGGMQVNPAPGFGPNGPPGRTY